MADIQVLNTDTDLSENTLLTEENAYTITGLHTYNRGTNPPFAVNSGAAKVDNLDADKLDGQTGTYYLAAANATGTLSVAQGGTGATSLTDGGLLLGSGTGAITALGVATNGQIPIGDGSGDPQLATISGTSNQIDVTNGAASITLSLSSSYVGQTSITTLGTIGTGTWEGTDVGVAHGGTGLSSYAAGDVIYASGTTTLAKLAKATDGDVLTLASGVPSWATPTVGDITAVTAGAGMTGGGTTGDVTLNVIGTTDKITVSADAVTIASGYVGQTSITTLGTIATGTWEGTDVAVAHGGTGASSLTDNAILMGNGTSAVTPGSGLYGYDSTAALRIEGADPYLSLKETTNTKEWKIQVVDDSSESLIQIPTPTGGTTTDWILRTWYNGATDYRASTTDNIRLFNADGTSERLRLGTSGVSFDGGSNYLDDYEEGTYTPYLYGATTGNTGDSTYRITGTTGNYCKIGRLVFVHFRFDNFTVPTNATGHLSITVPFTCNLADVGTAPMMNSMNISTNCTYSIVYCNGDHFRIYSIGDDVGWSLNNITDTSGAGRYIWASFTYYTDS